MAQSSNIKTAWTIEVLNGAKKTAADWGVEQNSFTRTRQVQGVDKLTFRAIVKDWTGAPLFSGTHDDGTILIVRRGVQVTGSHNKIVEGTGTVWFYGIITGVPRSGSSDDESLEYEVSGPWYWFEQLLFRQLWKSWDGVPVSQSHPSATFTTFPTSHVLVPFNEVTNLFITTEDQIKAVVNYVIANATPAAPMALGTVSIAATASDPDWGYTAGVVALNEMRDVMCAEVIRDMLRWTPDAVTWFDYSTEPLPTFHCKRWKKLDAVSLDLNDENVFVQGDIRARYDLKRPGVLLFFEQVNVLSVNGVQKVYRYNTSQKYPSNITGNELGCMVATLDLLGLNKNVQKAEMEVAPINANSAVDATKTAWWKQHYNALNDIRVTDIAISDVEFFVDGVQVPHVGGLAVPPYPNETTQGQVPDWLQGQGINSVQLEIRARCGCKVWKDDAHTQLAFDQTQSPLPIAVTITCSNADTNVYTSAQVTQQNETEPQNLAKFIGAGVVDILYFDGEVVTTENEITDRVNIGQRLNLLNGRAEWASMNAMIVQIVDKVGTGTSTSKLGPPEFLGAKDLIELLRINRKERFRIMSPATQASGQLDASQSISLGKSTPRVNATSIGGGAGGGTAGYG